ncbi:hypothetical protein B0H17DRAFT_1270013 [Mycena rosella]|uniref:Uncharacterized protein n=1 Tax=Mycena rosella TaxID=1033263 RepID=A0AAD7GL23_MYCRO|nr:hypothetical protein B0H17DRAFT_1270013 [Mycena rosella]
MRGSLEKKSADGLRKVQQVNASPTVASLTYPPFSTTSRRHILIALESSPPYVGPYKSSSLSRPPLSESRRSGSSFDTTSVGHCSRPLGDPPSRDSRPGAGAVKTSVGTRWGILHLATHDPGAGAVKTQWETAQDHWGILHLATQDRGVGAVKTSVRHCVQTSVGDRLSPWWETAQALSGKLLKTAGGSCLKTWGGSREDLSGTLLAEATMEMWGERARGECGEVS